MAAPDRWSDWLDEHGSRLLLFARQQARGEGGVCAEDLLQDALVRLWKRLGEVPPLPFAMREIRRLAIDQARSHDRRKRREEEAAAPHRQKANWFTGNSSTLAGSDITQLLSTLPKEQAETVVLKIWTGLTFREIGETTEVPTQTAAARYRTAMSKLRIRLAEDESSTGLADTTPPSPSPESA